MLISRMKADMTRLELAMDHTTDNPTHLPTFSSNTKVLQSTIVASDKIFSIKN